MAFDVRAWLGRESTGIAAHVTQIAFHRKVMSWKEFAQAEQCANEWRSVPRCFSRRWIEGSLALGTY